MVQMYAERPQAWEAMKLGPTPAQGDEFYEWVKSKIGEFEWPQNPEDRPEGDGGVNIDLTTGKLVIFIAEMTEGSPYQSIEPGTWLMWRGGPWFDMYTSDEDFNRQFQPVS